jgi:hypothetical protein
MSPDRLRELILLLAIGSALTLAVFFLALWLLPFEAFTPFPFPRFPFHYYQVFVLDISWLSFCRVG